MVVCLKGYEVLKGIFDEDVPPLWHRGYICAR